MTSTGPKHPSSFIAYEGSGGFSRETMAVAPNQTLVPGQVVSVKSGVNEVTALDPSGTDGSQIAAGILVYTVDNGPTTQKATILAHRAEVRASELTWPAKISNVQRAAAVKQLEAVGILVK